MGLDIRLPLAYLFAALGTILLVYGLATRFSGMYDRSLGLNLNILWGAVMVAFGLLMLALAYRSQRKHRPQ